MSWRNDPFEHSLAARGVKSRNIDIIHEPIYSNINSDLDTLFKRYQDSEITLEELANGIDVLHSMRKVRNKKAFLTCVLYLCEISDHPRTKDLRRMIPDNISTVLAEEHYGKRIDPRILHHILQKEDDYLDRTLDDLDVSPTSEPYDEEFLKKPLPAAPKEKRFSRLPVMKELARRRITFEHIREFNKMKSMLSDSDPEYNDAVAKFSMGAMPSVMKKKAIGQMDEKTKMINERAVKVLTQRGVNVKVVRKFMHNMFMYSNKQRINSQPIEVL